MTRDIEKGIVVIERSELVIERTEVHALKCVFHRAQRGLQLFGIKIQERRVARPTVRQRYRESLLMLVTHHDQRHLAAGAMVAQNVAQVAAVSKLLIVG